MNAVAKVDQEDVAESGARRSFRPRRRQSPVAAAGRSRARRQARPLRLLLMVSLPLALVAGGGYVWVTGGRYQDTENANLRQAKVSIASDAAGRIVEVDIADNAPVKAGDVLFAIDPEPYRIALAQADAALAAARLGVEQLRAAYSQAVAQERMAAGEVDYLKTQLDRADRACQQGHQHAVVARRGAATISPRPRTQQLAAAAGHRQRARRDRRRSRHRDRQASRGAGRAVARATRRP